MSIPAQGAVGAETRTAAERVCHEEQMVIWSGEMAERLFLGDWLREHLSYEDKLGFYADLSEGIREIVESALDLATPAPRSDGGMTAGEDANFGDAPHDLVSEIATQVLNLPWTRLGLTDPRSGHFDHDALADRHGDVQIIAEKALRDARASDAESAWPFERTRAYLLAELERLRADLHTIGEDLTGEQGKAASWLDVATGRAANVSSVLASAAPAQPAGAVPDSLRALSEAFAEAACCASCATPLDCYQGKPCSLEPAGSKSALVDHEFKSHPDVFWPAARGEKTFEYRRDDRGGYEIGQTVRLRCYDPTCGYHDAAPLDRRITNILRGGEFELPQGYCILSLAPLASHPAGQSAGSGAETDALVDRFSAALKVKLRAAEAKYGWKNGWLKSNWQVECQNGLLRHVGKGDPLDVAAYAAFCWHHGWPSASRRSTDFVTGAVMPTAGAIAAYETRYPEGSLSETSDNAIEAWNRVAAAVCLAEKPAPDSTRTGAAETEDAPGLLDQVSPEQAEAFERTARNLTNLYAPDGPSALCQGILAALLRAHIAARPEAPSDAGWSFDMEAAPRDGTPVIVAVTSIHEGHEPIVGQAFIDTDSGGHWWWAGTSYGDYYASPIHETNNPPYAWHPMLDAPTPPSDPAPSGQAEG